MWSYLEPLDSFLEQKVWNGSSTGFDLMVDNMRTRLDQRRVIHQSNESITYCYKRKIPAWVSQCAHQHTRGKRSLFHTRSCAHRYKNITWHLSMRLIWIVDTYDIFSFSLSLLLVFITMHSTDLLSYRYSFQFCFRFSLVSLQQKFGFNLHDKMQL